MGARPRTPHSLPSGWTHPRVRITSRSSAAAHRALPEGTLLGVRRSFFRDSDGARHHPVLEPHVKGSDSTDPSPRRHRLPPTEQNLAGPGTTAR